MRMNRRLSKLALLFCAPILLVAYNNCAAPVSLGGGGTTVGTPMVEFKFAPFTQPASQQVGVCINEIVLTLEDGQQSHVSVPIDATDRTLDAAGTKLKTHAIPAGVYSDIAVTLSANCLSGKSLQLSNLQGNFETSNQVTLHFSGRSLLTEDYTLVALDVQNLINSLNTVNNNTALVTTAENAAGDWSTATKTWSAIATTSAPSSRQDHTAIWTGSKMIVWGGSNTFNSPRATNTGASYDPGSDAWTALATSGAPAGRSLHTAVWTGTKMLIWGGQSDSAGVLQSGALYDPATNTWSAMSTTGAPTARYSHSAIWTGSKMIIWGGIASNGSKLNTGAAYDPATDTWSAITTTGAPTARVYHSAIWTGSQMLIWGGCSSSASGCPGTGTALNSGALFDPATNTWQSMGTSNAPTGRYRHSSVWTGTELVVWGGESYSSNNHFYLDDGARYNPATNTWVDMQTASAPSARSGQSAVWTGSRMIVWGGGGNSTFLNTGGVYDPSTNVWSALSTQGSPTARLYHTATWTGSDMIIWGGWNNKVSAVYLEDGARFGP
jgi:N-acetylneuraminic acid mutarotase